MRNISIYGPMQLFLSLAVMVMGSHLIVLASMESISLAFLMVGTIAVLSAVVLIMLNFRRGLRK